MPRKKQRKKSPIKKTVINNPPINDVKPKRSTSTVVTIWGTVIGIILTCILGYHSFKEDFIMSDNEKYEKENFVKGELHSRRLYETNNSNNTQTDNRGISVNTINGDVKYYTVDFPSAIGKHKVNGVLPIYEFVDNKNEYPIIKGIKIQNFINKKEIELHMGTIIFKMQPDFLFEGINILGLSPYTACSDDQDITLGVKDDRLYISTQFKDIKNEDVIGDIEFNHWKMFKPNFLKINQDDSSFEVFDRQGYNAFAIRFFEPNKLVVQGYFVGSSTIAVVNNIESIPCIDKSDIHWKDSAIRAIKKTKSIFKATL
ncbi:MAG: hypothetical protein JST82_10565 [Bacteroidetes bacterium]|nr:hypothetical protein [Bacteroidota bacterium]